MMIVWVVWCFLLGTGSSTRVPFDYTTDGFPYVNISLPALFGNATIPFVLLPCGQTEILSRYLDEDSVWCDDDQELILLSTRGDPTFRFVEPQLLMDHYADVNDINANLGIGPESALLESVASLDFRHDTSQLMLGGPLDDFWEDACLTGSLFSVATAGFGDHFFIETNLGNGSLRTSFTGANYLVGLPLDQLRILTQIIGLDDHERFAPIRIRDCMTVRSVLPNISLRISAGAEGHSSIVGTLVLYPDDYTELFRDGSCELLVGRTYGLSSDGAEASLNPLRLPQVNVRFTPTETWFCDSQS